MFKQARLHETFLVLAFPNYAQNIFPYPLFTQQLPSASGTKQVERAGRCKLPNN